MMVKNFFKIAYLILLWSGLPVAQAETEEDGRGWLSLYMQGKLFATDAYWSMDTHLRWRDEGQHFDQLILRPALFYKLNPQTSVWVGYDSIMTHPAGGSAFRENRVWQQLQHQFDEVAGFTFTSRSRLEQRKREDFSDQSYRLRQMLRVTRPSGWHPGLSWLVYDELFINLNQTDWGVQRGIDQNRLFVGVNWTLSHVANVDVGYLNQYINTRHADRENHVWMTTLRFNF